MERMLFRAKRTDNGEWVYWNMYGELVTGSGKRTRVVVRKDATTSCYDYIYQIRRLLDESAICQYTGLCDMNGRKIWENDLLDCQDRITVVKWNVPCGTWDSIFVRYKGQLCSNGINVAEWKYRAEVIGNRFDNLNLLEGGN